MYTLVALTLLAAIVTAMLIRKSDLERFEKVMITLMFSTIVLATSMMVLTVLGRVLPWNYVTASTISLASTRTVDGFNGQFFLGSGTIGTTTYYTYLAKNGDGFTPGRLEVSPRITIYEESRTDGVLIVKKPELIDSEWKKLVIFIPGEDEFRYEIRVPKGSVRQGFVIQ